MSDLHLAHLIVRIEYSETRRREADEQAAGRWIRMLSAVYKVHRILRPPKSTSR